MSDSKLACQASIDFMSGQKNMWTFTFVDAQTVETGSKLWSKALKDLVRYENFQGVRVYEMHENHGLHIHAVVNRYYPTKLVRARTERFGFGWPDVERIKSSGFEYVSKYLDKDRTSAFKRRRVWSCFGGYKGVKVKNIETRSDFSTLYNAITYHTMALHWGTQLPREGTREYNYKRLALTRYIYRETDINICSTGQISISTSLKGSHLDLLVSSLAKVSQACLPLSTE